MIKSKSRSMLCHIMENITDFEFRTPEALQLKQEMRLWYYGGRDGGEADKLIKQFNSLFSGNMFLDVSGDLLWSLVEGSPLELGSSLSGAMSTIPRRHIIGRSIRAYEIPTGQIQYQFEIWQEHILTVLEKIDQQLERERMWRKENRMSLPSALVSLAGIAALGFGILFLIPVVQSLFLSRSLEETVTALPSSWRWSPETTLVFLGIFTFATGDLLFLLPRMVMTLRAGSFWIFYHKGRYDLRRRRSKQFQRVMRNEGLGRYCEKLQTAAQQLADLTPDAPQDRDPSCELLGRTGMNKVFKKFSLKPISRGWSCKSFYKKVEDHHVRSRAWIVILCAALVFLRDLILTGPITA